MSSPPLADAAWPNAAPGDWPSYNRTPTSQRYSPLDQINTKNVGNLKVLCTYDLGTITAFESGLIMVDNALIGTTEYEIFSINPATCAENWRTHVEYRRSAAAGQPRRRLHGRHAVSRHPGRSRAGLRFQDRQTTVGDDDRRPRNMASRCRRRRLPGTASSTPAMRAETSRAARDTCSPSTAKTGKIVWEFFLVPKVEGDAVRGPLGKSPLDAATWNNAPGVPISGGGMWTSFTLDIKNGLLYVPGGNPAPDFASGAREGTIYIPTRSWCSMPRRATSRTLSRWCQRTGMTTTCPTRRSCSRPWAASS